MPLYEYMCFHCDNTWEAFNKIDARHGEICPVCKSPAVISIVNTAKPIVLEYYCEQSDTRITGPRQRKRVLREKNMEER